MSTLAHRVWFRIDEETKDRLDKCVQMSVGDQSDVLRAALERYLDDEDSLRQIIEAHKKEAQAQ